MEPDIVFDGIPDLPDVVPGSQVTVTVVHTRGLSTKADVTMLISRQISNGGEAPLEDQ
jgi:hypothetical protein